MPTTNQHSDASQEPSQTALILEHVEMLLAIHGDLQQNRHCELDNLIDTLEQSFESKTAEFNEKTESIVRSFQSQITGMFDSLGDRLTRISEGIATQEENVAAPVDPVEDSAEDSADDSADLWKRKKEAMLSKYGIDPNHRPEMEPAKSAGDIAETSEPPADVEADAEIRQPLNALHQSIDNISEADAEKIEQLKSELTSKLRDAEVELSINRAKLSQQKAELEAKKVELERRASAIEKKFASAQETPPKKAGFADRLTRHIRKRD